MKVIVTGSNGKISSSLLKHFERKNYHFISLSRTKKIPEEKDSTIIKLGNLFDEKFLRKYIHRNDIIIHTAAQTSGEKSFYIPLYDQETNVIGTCNVYNFAKMCKAKLMINMSSMGVYGSPKRSKIVDRDGSRTI